MKKLVLLAAAGALVVAFAGSAVAARGHAKHATTTALRIVRPVSPCDPPAESSTLWADERRQDFLCQESPRMARVSSASGGRTAAGGQAVRLAAAGTVRSGPG